MEKIFVTLTKRKFNNLLSNNSILDISNNSYLPKEQLLCKYKELENLLYKDLKEEFSDFYGVRIYSDTVYIL